MKATQVDGVYSADPKRDPAATRYEKLTHDEAIAKNLAVMDTAAFALARGCESNSDNRIFDQRARAQSSPRSRDAAKPLWFRP